jgi:hypothetical protein
VVECSDHKLCNIVKGKPSNFWNAIKYYVNYICCIKW